jgi:histone H3/H4
MKTLGLPELTTKQIERLCLTAEQTARKTVLSEIPSKQVETLNITAETKGTRPVTLTIDVEIVLPPSAKAVKTKRVADKAVKQAFQAAEKYLEELKRHSQT